MNGSDEGTLLHKLSQDKCLELVPMHVYYSILMVIGFTGNILVCRFYTKKAHTTPFTRLIVVLAMIDTAVCVLMPKNIATMCLSYRGYGNVPCKLNVFFNYFTGVFSSKILLTIAIVRFRAICRPCSSQFTLRHINIAILVLATFSVMESILPPFIIYGSESIVVKVNANVTITGYSCQQSKDLSRSAFMKIFSWVYFFKFVLCLMIMAIIYSLIGSTILKQNRIRKRIVARPMRKTAGTSVSGATEEQNGNSDTCSTTTIRDIGRQVEVEDNSNERTQRTRATVNISTAAIRQISMVFIITVIYILSYLPYLAQFIWLAKSGNNDNDMYTNRFQFWHRSYLINSAANPFVYGFFNTEFRQFVKGTICSRKQFNRQG